MLYFEPSTSTINQILIVGDPEKIVQLYNSDIMNTEKETPNLLPAISDATLQAIQKSYQAWQTMDFTIIDTLFSPDWQDIPMAPGQKAGPEGLKDLITFFNQTFPDIEITMHDIFGTAERIAVRSEITFTHDKEFMGILPVNQKVTVSSLEIHHLKNGKITHTWHLEDWFGLLVQSRAAENRSY
jgi:predicted ester cyclase